PLAPERGPALEDLPGQVLGRVRGDRARGLARRSRRRCGLSRRRTVTAGAAKAGARPHLGVGPGTARPGGRAALVAEPIRGRIVGLTGRAQHWASSPAPGILHEERRPLDNSGTTLRRPWTVRLLAYPAILVGAFVFLSLVSFWLAVRPPRIAVPLRPDEFRLAVEDVTITAAAGVKLAGWLAVRPGAPALVLLHGYPAEKADLLPPAAALGPPLTVLLLDQRYFGASGGRATTI